MFTMLTMNSPLLFFIFSVITTITPGTPPVITTKGIPVPGTAPVTTKGIGIKYKNYFKSV